MRARALSLVPSEPRLPTADRLLGWAKEAAVLAAILFVGFAVAHRLLVHNHREDGCCVASKAP